MPKHRMPSLWSAALFVGAFATAAVFWSACGKEKAEVGAAVSKQAPPPQMTTQTPSNQIQPPPPGAGHGETGMSWKAPEGWKEETPSSGMRKAQFSVPGDGGAAELVVFYFGPGQGGDAMANATRWASQLTKPDGSPATDTMKTEHASFGGMPTLLTEAEGTYQNTMGGSGEKHPGYKLLGAIVEGPDANWFFKMTGPAETVEANRDAFQAFLSSLRPGS
ncbi:MAG: hypothetical protein KDA27_22375 [Candidatus Eisenbacteria bacterium]|uniref:Lipoprotein n=1 Tax=Eiseniibacteriota bacterium TaxID=2212470 RepID=A0A956NGK5_UNCEI|nr:hypothetical protein [Candidatus Eisenbacteria bacterium]